MAQLVSGLPRLVRILGLIALVAVIAVAVYMMLGGGTKTGKAYFAEAKNIYAGDAIEVLGIKVGQIDSVKPAGNQVEVDFHYNSKYSLPSDVKAAIMSPTLVSTRFIQLDPPYSGRGPQFPDGGLIPQSRTAAPIEFDELKKSLAQLSDALGPNGVNQQGALNRALTVIDTNGRGQGQNFHDMITQLSRAAQTLSNGRGDLFGTVRNLAVFSSGLNQFDGQIVEFDNRLNDVSSVLDDNSDQLHHLLPTIDDAAHQVDIFLHDHAGQLSHTVDRASSISRALAQERGNIAQTLHIAPNTLTNFTNIFNPRTGNITAALTSNEGTSQLGGPGDAICEAITAAAAANEQQGQQMCVKYLGPVFAHLATEAPPVGVYALQVPRGVTAPNGDIEQRSHQADTNHSPNGTNSDLPRSTTANGGGNSGPGGGLAGLMNPGGN